MASAENNDENDHLVALSDSDYEIKDGQPDIQGWDIENSNGVKIGEVDDVLFDPQSNKVRYIVLDTENNDLDLEDGHVLIPIGVAELHENNDTVLIPEITVKQLIALPLYEKGRAISPEMEAEIRQVFTRPDNMVFAPTEDFHEHEHFNETKFYSKRKPITAEDHLLTEGGNHLLTEGGNHLLTQGGDHSLTGGEGASHQNNNTDPQKHDRGDINL